MPFDSMPAPDSMIETVAFHKREDGESLEDIRMWLRGRVSRERRNSILLAMFGCVYRP